MVLIEERSGRIPLLGTMNDQQKMQNISVAATLRGGGVVQRSLDSVMKTMFSTREIRRRLYFYSVLSSNTAVWQDVKTTSCFFCYFKPRPPTHLREKKTALSCVNSKSDWAKHELSDVIFTLKIMFCMQGVAGLGLAPGSGQGAQWMISWELLTRPTCSSNHASCNQGKCL